MSSCVLLPLSESLLFTSHACLLPPTSPPPPASYFSPCLLLLLLLLILLFFAFSDFISSLDTLGLHCLFRHASPNSPSHSSSSFSTVSNIIASICCHVIYFIGLLLYDSASTLLPSSLPLSCWMQPSYPASPPPTLISQLLASPPLLSPPHIYNHLHSHPLVSSLLLPSLRSLRLDVATAAIQLLCSINNYPTALGMLGTPTTSSSHIFI